MNSGFVQLVILLADDMMLLSSATVIGLQIQMKSLFIDGSWLQLQVNRTKSNIVVFTKGIQMPEKDGIYDDCNENDGLCSSLGILYAQGFAFTMLVKIW